MLFKKLYNRIPDWNNPDDIRLISDLNKKVDGKLPVFARSITIEEKRTDALNETEFLCLSCQTDLTIKSVSRSRCKCTGCEFNYKVEVGKNSVRVFTTNGKKVLAEQRKEKLSIVGLFD